jgi:hypothetical protein
VDPMTPPGRIDYFGDPDATRASTLVPSVNVVVTNGAEGILLIRRTDNGSWALPGGAIDLGESVAQAAGPRRSRSPGSAARSPGSWASTPTPGT